MLQLNVVNTTLVNSNFYHIYNRGVEKRKIFLSTKDYLRFIEAIDYYRESPQLLKLSDFRRKPNKELFIQSDRKEIVRIYCYCLMPNHFHFLIQQLEDGGITEFIRKLCDSYSKYFNTKYERVGSLFQGSFKAKLIETDEGLLQLSKYIHNNPQSIIEWKDKIFPYSSLNCYLENKIEMFIDPTFILSFFSTTDKVMDYKSFLNRGFEPEVIESMADLMIDF